jgi:hypothetical protein
LMRNAVLKTVHGKTAVVLILKQSNDIIMRRIYTLTRGMLPLVVAACAALGCRMENGEEPEPATFVNPIYEGADPFILRHSDGYYYFVQSEGGRGLSVWKSDRLTDKGIKRVVWRAPGTDMAPVCAAPHTDGHVRKRQDAGCLRPKWESVSHRPRIGSSTRCHTGTSAAGSFRRRPNPGDAGAARRGRNRSYREAA